MSTSPNRRMPFVGKTQNTLDNSAMLGAEFCKAGVAVKAQYNRSFATKYGEGHEFLLLDPKALTIKTDQYGHSSPCNEDDPEARKITRFAMPPLAGFDMAVQDLIAGGFDGFRHGDRVVIGCSEVQPTTSADMSPMPMFALSVDAR